MYRLHYGTQLMMMMMMREGERERESELSCRGVSRILGKGVLMYVRANFGHTHLRNGKVEVQIITKNSF